MSGNHAGRRAATRRHRLIDLHSHPHGLRNIGGMEYATGGQPGPALFAGSDPGDIGTDCFNIRYALLNEPILRRCQSILRGKNPCHSSFRFPNRPRSSLHWQAWSSRARRPEPIAGRRSIAIGPEWQDNGTSADREPKPILGPPSASAVIRSSAKAGNCGHLCASGRMLSATRNPRVST